jgi:AcrR family transcriptional regulator
MEFKLTFNVNETIYLKNPENSELGKKIIKTAIDLIYNIGFEHFTFKKLSIEVGTTEATIYRYFENKHRLLLYIINWYWYYMEFLVEFQLQNIQHVKDQLRTVIAIITNTLPNSSSGTDYNKYYLNQIVVAESSKVYLTKEVSEINQKQVFKPYKDLCARIANIITAYNASYKYPHSLSSTLIEASHQQQYFCEHLPKLTDIKALPHDDYTKHYLEDLLFKILD